MAKLTLAERVAAGTARYLAKHPGATRAEATGAAEKAAAQYDKRIASHLAKHPGALASAARGHGKTGEHGIDVTPLGGNQIAYTFRQERFAERAAERAEREAGEGGRVKLVVTDRAGNVRELFANNGHIAGMTAEELLKRIQEAPGGIREVAEEAMRGKYLDRHGVAHEIPLDGFDPSAIREYQLIVQ